MVLCLWIVSFVAFIVWYLFSLIDGFTMFAIWLFVVIVLMFCCIVYAVCVRFVVLLWFAAIVCWVVGCCFDLCLNAFVLLVVLCWVLLVFVLLLRFDCDIWLFVVDFGWVFVFACWLLAVVLVALLVFVALLVIVIDWIGFIIRFGGCVCVNSVAY